MWRSATNVGQRPVFYKGMSQSRGPGGDGLESLGITGPTKRERQKITPLGRLGQRGGMAGKGRGCVETPEDLVSTKQK